VCESNTYYDNVGKYSRGCGNFLRHSNTREFFPLFNIGARHHPESYPPGRQSGYFFDAFENRELNGAPPALANSQLIPRTRRRKTVMHLLFFLRFASARDCGLKTETEANTRTIPRVAVHCNIKDTLNCVASPPRVHERIVLHRFTGLNFPRRSKRQLQAARKSCPTYARWCGSRVDDGERIAALEPHAAVSRNVFSDGRI